MYYLVISRSVEHGLRSDQKSIFIDPINADDYEVILRDGEKIYRKYRISNLEDHRLTSLLETLRHTLVD